MLCQTHFGENVISDEAMLPGRSRSHTEALMGMFGFINLSTSTLRFSHTL